jgi:hypothetical protein
VLRMVQAMPVLVVFQATNHLCPVTALRSGVFDCTQLYPQHDGHDIGAMETKESHESS